MLYIEFVNASNTLRTPIFVITNDFHKSSTVLQLGMAPVHCAPAVAVTVHVDCTSVNGVGGEGGRVRELQCITGRANAFIYKKQMRPSAILATVHRYLRHPSLMTFSAVLIVTASDSGSRR